jgi:hypothetical protein
VDRMGYKMDDLGDFRMYLNGEPLGNPIDILNAKAILDWFYSAWPELQRRVVDNDEDTGN